MNIICKKNYESKIFFYASLFQIPKFLFEMVIKAMRHCRPTANTVQYGHDGPVDCQICESIICPPCNCTRTDQQQLKSIVLKGG